jgi:hypothetical protein
MRRDFSSRWVLAGGVDVKGGLPAEAAAKPLPIMTRWALYRGREAGIIAG